MVLGDLEQRPWPPSTRCLCPYPRAATTQIAFGHYQVPRGGADSLPVRTSALEAEILVFLLSCVPSSQEGSGGCFMMTKSFHPCEMRSPWICSGFLSCSSNRNSRCPEANPSRGTRGLPPPVTAAHRLTPDGLTFKRQVLIGKEYASRSGGRPPGEKADSCPKGNSEVSARPRDF